MRRIFPVAWCIIVIVMYVCAVNIIGVEAETHDSSQTIEGSVETAAIAEEAHAEHEAHHKKQVMDFVWRLVDFIVLAFILYKVLSKAIKGFLAGRKKEVAAAIGDAEGARESARTRYDECMGRLEAAESEIGDIVERMKAQGRAEKDKIIGDARNAAEEIRRDAKARMDMEFKEASLQLRAEATELAVQLAEDVLKRNIDTKDHEKMVGNFLDGMVRQN